MQEFLSERFFSLEGFAHKALFDQGAAVWEALRGLSTYLERAALGKIESEVPKTVYLANVSQISIGPGCVIEPGAYIEGPVILGPKTVVRHAAYIRGFVVTGEGCIIGHATEVKHSIFLDRASAAHFNYVGDSILGRDVNLGAGVKLANFRLDHAPVTFFHAGDKVATGLNKLGAILGDGVQLGCNAVTSPGTLMGPESMGRPCATVRGMVAAKTVYKE